MIPAELSDCVAIKELNIAKAQLLKCCPRVAENNLINAVGTYTCSEKLLSQDTANVCLAMQIFSPLDRSLSMAAPHYIAAYCYVADSVEAAHALAVKAKTDQLNACKQLMS